MKTTILREQLERFSSELTVANYSHLTVSGYARDINDYIDSGLAPKEYILSLEVSARTIGRKMSSLKKFFAYLVSNGLEKENPFANGSILYPKISRRLPKYLTKDDVDFLLALTTNTRDFLVISLLFETGARIQELCRIRFRDIDFPSHTIRILGKGNKERMVYFTESTGTKILTHLGDRYSGFLFMGNKNKGIGARALQKVLAKYSKLIKKYVTPHTLRHSFATYMLEQGATVKDIQMMLGHEHLSTTMIYIHSNNARLRNIHKQCFKEGEE